MAKSLRAQNVHVGLVIVYVESGAGSPLLPSTDSALFFSIFGLALEKQFLSFSTFANQPIDI